MKLINNVIWIKLYKKWWNIIIAKKKYRDFWKNCKFLELKRLTVIRYIRIVAIKSLILEIQIFIIFKIVIIFVIRLTKCQRTFRVIRNKESLLRVEGWSKND